MVVALDTERERERDKPVFDEGASSMLCSATLHKSGCVDQELPDRDVVETVKQYDVILLQ